MRSFYELCHSDACCGSRNAFGRRLGCLLLALLILFSVPVFSGCDKDGNVPGEVAVLSPSDSPAEEEEIVYKNTFSDGQYGYVPLEDGKTAAVYTILEVTSTDISIPEKANGLTVSSVTEKAFSGRTELTSVTLPNTVSDIGDRAFEGCARLTSINLDKVKNIGEYAFSGCFSLDGVTFGDTKSIGTGAFDRCFSLRAAALPSGLAEMGSGVFAYCSSLGELSVGNRCKACVYSEPLLLSADLSRVLMCKPNISGPVSVPEGVIEIAERSFAHCVGVTSVSLPSSVTEIGRQAFYNCAALGEVGMPASVTKIGASAFEECDSLAAFSIPDSVTEVGEKAFFNCDRLRMMYIGSALDRIGDGAFAGCPVLKDVSVGGGNPNYVMSDGVLYTADRKTIVMAFLLRGINPKTNDYTLPEGIEHVGPYAFYGRKDIAFLTLPNGITDIGAHSFSWCPYLCVINLPATLVSIGESAFEYSMTYERLGTPQTLYIPDSVTDIGKRAFARCYKLDSIVLSAGLKGVPDEAFDMCGKLMSVSIRSASFIGNEAFSGCINLRSVALPDGVEKIGSGAFRGCERLREITFPDSLAEVGKEAFYSCPCISRMSFGSGLSSLSPYAFIHDNALQIISVSEENPNYSSADGVLMSKDGTIIYSMPPAITGSYTIPDGVTSVAAGAFCCSALSTVVIPQGVTAISDDAFHGCEDRITLRGAVGSYASEYAEEHGMAFVAVV